MDDTFERFPKLHSPFVREETEDEKYLVTPTIADEYEWVFTDDAVSAVEKLDGENIAVHIDEDYSVTQIYTREGIKVDPFGEPTHTYIVKGVLDAYRRGWISEYLSPGINYGELVGPQAKDKYDLDTHYWVPFEYARENLSYQTWGEYPRTFTVISEWFEDNLYPQFYSRIHNLPTEELPNDAYVEGIIFTHPDGRKAKLRRDMFDWYYNSTE